MFASKLVKAIKKRVRSSNWDEEEKRTECSTNTNALKKAAWQEILCSFNTINSKHRDMTQLITQWRNTKGQVKSRESEYRRARLLTGGGLPPPSPPPEDREILQIIPNEFVVDSNCFDSDSIFIETMKQSQISERKSESEVTLKPTVTNEIIDTEESAQVLYSINNTKKSKENQERREEEIHRKRMIILDLEQKYWEKKIKKLE
ncbi:hypothetical protein ACJJTC_018941 [Scirpophaga incertulas]